MDTKTIIISDWYNALYVNGLLVDQGKPEYLDGETMLNIMPTAGAYQMPDEVYDELLDGAGYPRRLANLPLDRMEKIR